MPKSIAPPAEVPSTEVALRAEFLPAAIQPADVSKEDIIHGGEVDYIETDSKLRQVLVPLHKLLALSNNYRDDRVPGHISLTHPDAYAETCLPSKTPLLLGDGESHRFTVPGLTYAYDLIFQNPSLGAPKLDVREYAFADSRLVPSIYAMRAAVNATKARGGYTPLEDLVDGNGDVIYIFEATPPGVDIADASRFKKNGSLILRSIVSTEEVHSEDMLVRHAKKIKGRTPEGDHYEYLDVFADNESNLRSEDMAFSDAFDDAIDKPNMKNARNLLTGLVHQILSPTSRLSPKIKSMYTTLKDHPGSAAEPSRAILRAYYKLEELDKIEAERPNTNDDINKQRQRIWFGLSHMGRYMNFLNASQKTYLFQQMLLGQNVAQDPKRLEFLAFDDTDAKIAETVTDKLEEYGRLGLEDVDGLNILRELQEHLLHNKRDSRTDNFIVKVATDSSELRDYINADPNDSSYRDIEDLKKYATRIGLPFFSASSYIDELINSVLDPNNKNKEYFPLGIALDGLVAVFSAITPEEINDNTSHRTPVYVAMSAKYSPNPLFDRILKPLLAGGTLKEQRAITEKLLNGSTDYVEIMTEDREQSWLELMDAPADKDLGLPRRMEPRSGKPFRNGDVATVAYYYNEKGERIIYFDRGKNGQNPVKRRLNQMRKRSDFKKSVGETKYEDPRTGKLDTGKKDADGNPIIIDNRLQDVMFVNGGFSVMAVKDKSLRTYVPPHFRNYTTYTRFRRRLKSVR